MEPTTGKAKYYTLMEALKEQILSGTIKPGQKLPSENELTRHLLETGLVIFFVQEPDARSASGKQTHRSRADAAAAAGDDDGFHIRSVSARKSRAMCSAHSTARASVVIFCGIWSCGRNTDAGTRSCCPIRS